MEGMIGEIRMFAGNFAPKNWAFCFSQIIAIQQNTALFSILGTTYGGNGTTTFQLPDLQGKIPIGVGSGPGLSPVVLGDEGGSVSVTLTSNEMPIHTHAAAVSTVSPGAGTGKIALGNDPTGNYAGETGASLAMYTSSSNANMGTSPVTATIGVTGSGLPFPIVQPGLGMNYIICMYGIFPARN